MKKNIIKKSWVLACLLLFIGISITPAVYAHRSYFSPIISKTEENYKEDLIEITCHFSIFKGGSKVVKMISSKTIEKISILTEKIYLDLETPINPQLIKQKIITLVDELKNIDLLPSTYNSKKVATLLTAYITISQKISMGSQQNKIRTDNNSLVNRLNFVIAYGHNASCFPFFRSSVINSILWFLFNMNFITIQQLNDIQYNRDHQSRILLGIGDVYFENSGIAVTLGASGFQTMKDDTLALVLFGFIGLILISEQNGIVIGFTLQTFMF